MVIVSNRKAILKGNSVDTALDIITFLGTINQLKQADYEEYKMVEYEIKSITKEFPSTVDIIKEFAVNMTEIFS